MALICPRPSRALFKEPAMNKSSARTRADIQFSSHARDEQLKSEIVKERARTDAKTEKLKALRLARDAEQARADALLPPKPVKRRKAAKVPAADVPAA
jgi:hypothetical protein